MFHPGRQFIEKVFRKEPLRWNSTLFFLVQNDPGPETSWSAAVLHAFTKVQKQYIGDRSIFRIHQRIDYRTDLRVLFRLRRRYQYKPAVTAGYNLRIEKIGLDRVRQRELVNLDTVKA